MPDSKLPPRDPKPARPVKSNKPVQNEALREALMLRWLPTKQESFFGWNVPQNAKSTGEVWTNLPPVAQELLKQSAVIREQHGDPIGEYDDDNNFISVGVK
jgi:hypothetical protein